MKKHEDWREVELGPFAKLDRLLCNSEQELLFLARELARKPSLVRRESDVGLGLRLTLIQDLNSLFLSASSDPAHRRRIEAGGRWLARLMPWTTSARAAAAALRIESKMRCDVSRFDQLLKLLDEEQRRRMAASRQPAPPAQVSVLPAPAAPGGGAAAGGRGRGGRGAAQAHVPPASPAPALQLEDEAAEQKRLAALEPEQLAGLSSSSAEDVLAFLALDEPQPSRERPRG